MKTFLALSSLLAVFALGVAQQPTVKRPQRKPLPEPKYLDATASRTVKQALVRYAQLGKLQILVPGASPYRFSIDGLRFKESGGGVVWVHEKGYLKLLNARTNTFFRGQAVRAEVIEQVALNGRRVDPFMRTLLVRQNYVRSLFDLNQTARTLGQAKLGGASCTLVELRSKGEKLILAVRQKDGLLASVSSQVTESAGIPMSRLERTFRYERVGSVAPGAFQLNPGSAKVKPLPKVPVS